jgi:hypothetical protein
LLASFGDKPPATGACFTVGSDKLREHGLSVRHVVVALDGIPVENRDQYLAARSVSDSPDMTLFIWNGRTYSEVKANVPGRRFNTDLRDYRE